MASTRLRAALESGALTLPDGPLAVIRPSAGDDLSPLRKDRVTVVTGAYPDFAHFEAAGYAVSCEIPEVDTVLVTVPRSKSLAQALLAEAAAKASLLIVDGAKTNGVDSLYRACVKRLGPLDNLTKAHGRIFWTTGARLDDWSSAGPQIGPHGYVTAPGVYSEGAVDPGSAMLVAALPERLPGRVVDLGAGWGFLATEILKRQEVTNIALVEAEAIAIDCARRNVTDPRASFHWTDARHCRPEDLADFVVMNPPFHQSRAADPALGQAFIIAASAMLGPRGTLYMVANRNLPYEGTLTQSFGQWEVIGGDNRFKIFKATRPIRARG